MPRDTETATSIRPHRGARELLLLGGLVAQFSSGTITLPGDPLGVTGTVSVTTSIRTLPTTPDSTRS